MANGLYQPPFGTLPVTSSELTSVQQGILFTTNAQQAIDQANLINAATPGGPTVNSYANTLLAAGISTSQVAMADFAFATGKTDTVAHLGGITLNFLPPQVQFAEVNNLLGGPTVYAAQVYALALARDSTNGFATSLSSQVTGGTFVTTTAALTGTNTDAIANFFNVWFAFYTQFPNAAPGLSAQVAAAASAWGDAMGVALGRLPTDTGPGITQARNIQNLVKEALFDNAQTATSPPGQKYVEGVSISSLPVHTPWQGDTTPPANQFNLTPTIDTFNTTLAKAVFIANPVVTALGIAVNTLNQGDTLSTTDGLGTLNLLTAPITIGANPSFATGVTMSGVSTANISGQAGGGAITGFQGTITGLATVNVKSSIDQIQLGGVNQGLQSLLTDVNISGYGGTNDEAFTAFFTAGAADLTKTINVTLTGNVGTTKAADAFEIAFSNDSGQAGTAGNPNKTYGTWSVTANNTANLTLDQDEFGEGVGAATTLVLAGAGNIAVGQGAVGDWQFLQTLDYSKTTGKVVVTGATSGTATQAFASAANPGWLFGAEGAGLLDNTGAAWNLTSVLLGTGLTFLDVSSASATQVAALTTTPGATVAVGNEIIVKDSVATTLSALTFANIKGFDTLGIGGTDNGGGPPTGGAAGTINMALLPATIGTIIYRTVAQGDVFINNQTSALTVNTEDNGAGFRLTVGAVGPAAGLQDSFHLIVGNTFHAAPGEVGTGVALHTPGVRLNGDELVTITSQGANTNKVGFVELTPTGPTVQVTIDGNKNIDFGVEGDGAIASVTPSSATIPLGGVTALTNSLSIVITNTGITRFHSSANTTPNGFLDLFVPGDTANGSGPGGLFPLVNSTNAASIDASKSGGLIMEGGDFNYTPSLTVAGSLGDTLIGSTTAGNVLGGSIGNDTFSALNNANNTIFTSGGGDKVNLLAGHVGSDVIGIYAGFSTPGITPGDHEVVRFQSIVDLNDVPQLGWWNQASAATATGYTAGGDNYGGLVGPQTGTSADATTVSNFNVASDFIDLSDSQAGYQAGGPNGVGAGTAQGLVQGDLTPLLGSAAGGGGTPAVLQNVGALGTVNATTTLIELNGQTFADAGAVAFALHNAYTIDFAAKLGKNDSAHVYIAYQDFATNLHISDLAIINTSGAKSSNTGDFVEHVSDLVILPGVSITQLTAASDFVHFINNV